MKKKPNTKPTEQDLKDWNSFIENINSIEDKDAFHDSLTTEKKNDRLFDIRKDLHGLKMHEALDVVSNTVNDAIEKKTRKIFLKFFCENNKLSFTAITIRFPSSPNLFLKSS